jgi:hypothetical protein
MKITICGSINFALEMIKIKGDLEKKDHQVNIPYFVKKIRNGEYSYEEYINEKKEVGDINIRNSENRDFIKGHWDLIKDSDAILVFNLSKNGIKGYIGGSSLMEMGFAYILDKKIFLLNKIPKKSKIMHYIDEILDMKPIVIDKDLNKIK